MNIKQDYDLTFYIVKQGAIVGFTDNCERNCIDYAKEKGNLEFLRAVKDGLTYRRILFLNGYRLSMQRLSAIQQNEQKENYDDLKKCVLDPLFYNALWDKQILSMILDFEFPRKSLRSLLNS